mgnify:FL=1|jgi:hypothetical protein
MKKAFKIVPAGNNIRAEYMAEYCKINQKDAANGGRA